MAADDHIVGQTDRIVLRLLRSEDEDALLATVAASTGLHHPWVQGPSDAAAFRDLLARSRADARTLVGWRRDNGNIAAVVNLTQLARGNFQSCYAGFWASAASAGRGLTRETLDLCLEYAFGAEGLHRVEANVQPGNARSIALVRSLGFGREGFSPRYLRIDGEWRDHERYALTVEDWRSVRSASASAASKRSG